MTIRVQTNLSFSGSNGTSQREFIYRWLDFMRTASPNGPGWTVPIASDGSTVDTGGAGANITSEADLSNWVNGVSKSYFVLRAPDGSRELLVYRNTTTISRFDVQRVFGASYSGGDKWNLPTAAGSVGVNGSDSFCSPVGGSMRQHCIADDASPYAFVSVFHIGGAPQQLYGAVCEVPLDSGLDTTDDEPLVWYNADDFSDLGSTSTSFNTWRPYGTFFGSSPGNGVCSALTLESNGGNVFPDSAQKNSAGDDRSMPIPWGRRAADTAPNGFKGFSTWMQWNGVNRPFGSLFAGGTRISLTLVNVPWDPTVVPVV